MDLPRHEGRRGLPRARDEPRSGRDGTRRDRRDDARGRVATAGRGDARVHDPACLPRRDPVRQRRVARGGAVPVARRRRRRRRDSRPLAPLLLDEPRGRDAAARGRPVGDHEPRAVLTERARARARRVLEDRRALDVQPGGRRLLLHRRGQAARSGPGRHLADRGGAERDRHGAVHPGGARKRAGRRRGAGRVVRRAAGRRKAAVARGRGVRESAGGASGRGAVLLWGRAASRGLGGAGRRPGDRGVDDVPRTRVLRRDAEGVPERGRAGVAKPGGGRAADRVGGESQRDAGGGERAGARPAGAR